MVFFAVLLSYFQYPVLSVFYSFQKVLFLESSDFHQMEEVRKPLKYFIQNFLVDAENSCVFVNRLALAAKFKVILNLEKITDISEVASCFQCHKLIFLVLIVNIHFSLVNEIYFL